MFQTLKYTQPEVEIAMLQSEGSVCQAGSFSGAGLEHLIDDGDDIYW